MHARTHARTHTHTQPFYAPPWILSRTTQVNQHQKGKTNLDLLEQEIVRGSGISWPYANPHLDQDTLPHQHPTTQFLQAGCPLCHPTNSVKAMKAQCTEWNGGRSDLSVTGLT